MKKLKVKTVIGVYQHERTQKQDIIIDITLKIDDSKAILSDNIDDTVDYHRLSEEITNKVGTSNFFLIEKLCDFILEIILKDKNISKAKVTVTKPNCIPNCKNVSVTKKSQ